MLLQFLCFLESGQQNKNVLLDFLQVSKTALKIMKSFYFFEFFIYLFFLTFKSHFVYGISPKAHMLVRALPF